MTLDELVATFSGAKPTADGGYMVTCPAHEDRKASLHVDQTDDRLLLHCHAGCDLADVLAAVGLEAKDLFLDGPAPKREIVATYDYVDELGVVVYQAVRYRPKDFRVRRPDGAGGWSWNLKGAQRVLYHLDLIAESDPGRTVHVPEGEKDADALIALGLLATTNVGGAGKWRPEYSETLRGRHVVILPDNDDPGREHARKIKESLARIASSCTIVELPDLPPKGDVSDWLRAGGSAEKLSALVDRAREQSAPGVRYLSLAVRPAPIEWLVDGWLARRDIVLLAGRAGCGKSTTAADLAVALAGGRNGRGWLGMEPASIGHVLYLDEEAGADAIHRLFDSLGAAGDKTLANLHVSSCQGLTLGDAGALERIEHDIETLCPSLVVLDTASHFWAGVDENSATEVGATFRPLFRFRDLYGTTFLVIHHLRKPPQNGADDLLDRVRGSTAFTTQSSVVWSAVPAAAGDCIDLAVQKRRGGSKTSIRVKYEESRGEITLTGLGPPERVETQLDACSRFIVTAMREAKRESWTTAEIVATCSENGHGERTSKGALKHLVGIGSVSRVNRGIYVISRVLQDSASIFPELSDF